MVPAAIVAAYEKCQRLHRDVSLDNIILYRYKKGERRKGVLIDWEFSVPVNRDGRARDYHRSVSHAYLIFLLFISIITFRNFNQGTWAYMSTFVLQRIPGFLHMVQDDLESLFYVSMYCSLRWLEHNVYEGLGNWMYGFFDEIFVENNVQTGGSRKTLYKSYANRFGEMFRFENNHIDTWFKDAYKDLSTYLMPDQIATTRWTISSIRRNLRAVCEALCLFGQKGLDRVEHSLEDQAIPDIPDKAIAWATHITTTNTPSASRFSEVSHPDPECGQKRSRSVYEEVSAASAAQNKRSRVSMLENGGEGLPSPHELDDDDVDPEEEDEEKKNRDKLLERVDDIIKEIFPQQFPDEDNGQLVSYSDH